MMFIFSTDSRPKVAVISDVSDILNSKLLDVVYLPSIDSLEQLLHVWMPDAIVTYHPDGWEAFLVMNEFPDWIKRIWYHYTDYVDYSQEIYSYIHNNQLSGYSKPEFSIFTPLYNSKYLLQAYESVKNQTLNDWEWILVDDSPIGCQETETLAREIASKDFRVKFIRYSNPTNGNIGLSKHRACSNCSGRFFLELDHDDELLPFALQMVYDAIKQFPFSGFFYSDFTDIDANGNPIIAQYGDEFAFGFGHAYTVMNGSEEVPANESPNINSVTARHIVGMPNHLRCWSREIYNLVGGHNKNMRIADDYELLVRTFLTTKFTRIQYPLYRQRFDGNNSQDAHSNRDDIQRRVYEIATFYNSEIHNEVINQSGIDLGYEKDKPINRIYEAGAGVTLPFCNNLFVV